MNGFVTLFRNIGKQITIYNGFSFVDHLLSSHEYIFIDLDDVQNLTRINYYKEILRKFSKIYCTVLFSNDLTIISPLIDDRWTFGGPLVNCSRSNRISNLSVDNNTLEKLFNQPVSSKFSKYWDNYFFNEYEKPIDQINYMASLSNNCYWGKCKYCNFNTPNKFIRNSKYILSNLKGYEHMNSTVHTCSSATSLAEITSILQELPRFRKENISVLSFVRADKFILDSIKSTENLVGFLIELGIESFSQTLSDQLNKGISKKVELNIIKETLLRNGRIDCTIMHPLSIMDKQTFIESKNYLKELLESIKSIDYIGKLKFCIVGPPQFSNKKEAMEFGKCSELEITKLYNSIFDRFESWDDEIVYINDVKKDSDSEKYNNEFFNILSETGLVRGNNYWYMKGKELCA